MATKKNNYDYTLNGRVNATNWTDFKGVCKEHGINCGTKKFIELKAELEAILDAKASVKQEDEFVLIVCKSFDNACVYEKNIAIKKIPQSLLKNCEFGRDDYSLNIICPPEYEEDCDE